MKLKNKILCVFTALLLSCQYSPAYAQIVDNSLNPTGVELTLCESIAEFANTTMEARQYGVSKPKLLSILHEENKLVRVDKETINLYEAIIEDAYKQPVVPYTEIKQSLINTFSNAVYNICKKEY